MHQVSRRSLLAAAATAGAGGAAGYALSAATGAPAAASPAAAPPLTGNRAEQACQVREMVARARRAEGSPEHETNGDADLEPSGLLAYSKGLPHTDEGTPDPVAWRALRAAIQANDFDAVERVPMSGERRLVNPLAAFAYPLAGLDPSQLRLDPPPATGSEEFATELIELQWMAAARDVPFARWGSDATIAGAVAELGARRHYPARDRRGAVTAGTVLRGEGVHDLVGPYISQYLWLRVPGGALPADQKVRAYLPGFDFLAERDDWLRSQRGQPSQQASPSTPRFVHSLRSLASYVHGDYAFQLPLNAALVLLGSADANDVVGVTVPYARTNPYLHTKVQGPFATLCQPQILELLGMAAGMALRAAWFQKWLVHFRMRPEEAAGLFDRRRSSFAASLASSAIIRRVISTQGNALLKTAYPDGAPLHPSYPSGHATIGGACCTILKACFDESDPIDQPVMVTEDGLGLVPYQGQTLRVGGELDKLAANLGYGRNAAGIHYRSDAEGGKRLGEAVAIALLRDVRATLPEPFQGFAFTSFDGTRITI